MEINIQPMIAFAASVLFVFVNIYNGFLVRFYVRKQSNNVFNRQIEIAQNLIPLYFIPIFELFGLFFIGKENTLFYINSFSLLIYPSVILLIIESVFYNKKIDLTQCIIFFAPLFIPFIYMATILLNILPYNKLTLNVMYCLIIIPFGYYFAKQIIYYFKRRKEDIIDMNNYFKLIPICISLILFLCFVSNIEFVKVLRDVLMLGASVLITTAIIYSDIYTAKKGKEQREEEPKYYLSKEESDELERQIVTLIEGEKLFVDSRINLETISKMLSTTRQRVSEAVNRSEYKSLHNMVSVFRIEMAADMLVSENNVRLDYVAYETGFSSPSSFSQVFKRLRGMTPTEYINNHRIEVEKKQFMEKKCKRKEKYY